MPVVLVILIWGLSRQNSHAIRLLTSENTCKFTKMCASWKAFRWLVNMVPLVVFLHSGRKHGTFVMACRIALKLLMFDPVSTYLPLNSLPCDLDMLDILCLKLFQKANLLLTLMMPTKGIYPGKMGSGRSTQSVRHISAQSDPAWAKKSCESNGLLNICFLCFDNLHVYLFIWARMMHSKRKVIWRAVEIWWLFKSSREITKPEGWWWKFSRYIRRRTRSSMTSRRGRDRVIRGSTSWKILGGFSFGFINGEIL